MAKKHTLGARERLKSRKLIGQLFSEGRAFSNFPFRVVWMFHQQPEQPALQAGFTASARQFKKATDRNRIKRLMREGWRLNKNPLQEQLAVSNKRLAIFLIYTGNELPTFSEVNEKIIRAIQRISKLVHENSAADT